VLAAFVVGEEAENFELERPHEVKVHLCEDPVVKVGVVRSAEEGKLQGVAVVAVRRGELVQAEFTAVDRSQVAFFLQSTQDNLSIALLFVIQRSPSFYDHLRTPVLIWKPSVGFCAMPLQEGEAQR